MSAYSDARAASARAKLCLPPVIARVVSDRVEDVMINNWLGEGYQWQLLVDEINHLPEPEEKT